MFHALSPFVLFCVETSFLGSGVLISYLDFEVTK